MEVARPGAGSTCVGSLLHREQLSGPVIENEEAIFLVEANRSRLFKTLSKDGGLTGFRVNPDDLPSIPRRAVDHTVRTELKGVDPTRIGRNEPRSTDAGEIDFP